MAANAKTGTKAGTTRSRSTGRSSKTGSTTAGAKPKAAERKGADSAVTYVRQTGERAVDVPVGVVLTARDRVNDAVQPWTKSTTRDQELKGLREQVKRELGKFERRGGQARRKASQRVRRTRTRVERRVRRVETTVTESRARVEDGLRRAQTSVQERVSSLA